MGITVDIESRTSSIPPEKLLEITRECLQIFLRDRFTKRELQSLLGKLLYISLCGRFTSFSQPYATHSFRESRFTRDTGPIQFIQFLAPFNGVLAFKR